MDAEVNKFEIIKFWMKNEVKCLDGMIFQRENNWEKTTREIDSRYCSSDVFAREIPSRFADVSGTYLFFYLFYFFIFLFLADVQIDGQSVAHDGELSLFVGRWLATRFVLTLQIVTSLSSLVSWAIKNIQIIYRLTMYSNFIPTTIIIIIMKKKIITIFICLMIKSSEIKRLNWLKTK